MGVSLLEELTLLGVKFSPAVSISIAFELDPIEDTSPTLIKIYNTLVCQ